MTPVFTSARRAAEFDALVERGANDARYADLLALVAGLRELPQAEPRPEFSAVLRERLMTEAETLLVPSPTSGARARATSPTRRRERRVAAAVAGLSLVGATSGVAMASQGALPGDPLYGVKRALESVHTQLSLTDAAKGRTLLDDASGRLSEVSALADEGSGSDQIVTTLNTFGDQAGDGANLLLGDYADNRDPALIVALRDFTGAAVARLADLDGRIPADARPALLRAASRIFVIDARAQAACPGCGGTGVTTIPPSLVSDVAPAVPALAPKTGGGHHKHSSAAGGPSAPASPTPQSTSSPAPTPDATTAVPTQVGDPVKSLKNQLTTSVPTSLPKPGNLASSLSDPLSSAVGGATSPLPLP